MVGHDCSVSCTTLVRFFLYDMNDLLNIFGTLVGLVALLAAPFMLALCVLLTFLSPAEIREATTGPEPVSVPQTAPHTP